MQKIVAFLLLPSLFFQSLPMDHRVAMKKMHEQYEQPENYKADDRPILAGEPRLPHRQNLILDCAGSSGWGKKFMGLALCTILITAEAAPVFARTKSHQTRSHKDTPVRLRQSRALDQFSTANSTLPIDDDGTRCLEPASDYRQVCAKKPECISVDIRSGVLWHHIETMYGRIYDISEISGSLEQMCHETEAANRDLVKLLKCGAVPDERSEHGTPLMEAAIGGFAPFISTLLKAGAKADAVDRNGFTALDWAILSSMPPNNPFAIVPWLTTRAFREPGRRQCVEFLMEHLHLEKAAVQERIVTLVEQLKKNEPEEDRIAIRDFLSRILLKKSADE